MQLRTDELILISRCSCKARGTLLTVTLQIAAYFNEGQENKLSEPPKGYLSFHSATLLNGAPKNAAVRFMGDDDINTRSQKENLMQLLQDEEHL